MTITRLSVVTKIMPRLLLAAIRRRGWSAAPVARSTGSCSKRREDQDIAGVVVPPTVLAALGHGPHRDDGHQMAVDVGQGRHQEPDDQTGHQ